MSYDININMNDIIANCHHHQVATETTKMSATHQQEVDQARQFYNENNHPEQLESSESLDLSTGASLKLFNKNFTTLMKYSNQGNTIDINMALTSPATTSSATETLTATTTTQSPNSTDASSNTSSKSLNSLTNNANIANNLLKRQCNSIQTNLFQVSNNNSGSSKFSNKTLLPTQTSKSSTYSSSSNSNSSSSSSSSSSSNSSNDTPVISSIQTSHHHANAKSESSPSSNKTHIPNNAGQTKSATSPLAKSKSIGPNQYSQQSKIPVQVCQSTAASNNNNNNNNGKVTQLNNVMNAATTGATAAAATTSGASKSSHQNHQNHHHHHAQTTTANATITGNAFNIENELIKYTKTLKLNVCSYSVYYKLGQHIRNGGFSQIYEGTHLKTNETVIIKLIPKLKTKNWLMVHNKKYPAEILLHKMSNNINGVVKMLEFFEQEQEWIITMPKLENCLDLFDYLESKQRGRLNEHEACHFFKQLVKINQDLHNQGVVHRDIKSENLLVDLDTMKLILIDFGASAIYRQIAQNSGNNGTATPHFYSDFHGTRQYKPPEYILNKKYTAQASTIWTLGILLYDMCNGQLPFETEQEILDYNLQIKANVSDEYRSLLADCLNMDPLKRPSLNDLLDSAWCAKFSKPVEQTTITIESSSQSSGNNNNQEGLSVSTTSIEMQNISNVISVEKPAATKYVDNSNASKKTSTEEQEPSTSSTTAATSLFSSINCNINKLNLKT